MNLNIGCGNMPLEGYINIDKYYYPGCPLGDLDSSKIGKYDWQFGDATDIPFTDNIFDKVIMVHSLEHLSMDDGNIAIKEASRVLKSGEIIEIEVPDLYKACQLFIKTPVTEPIWERIMGLFYGTTGRDGEGQFHLTGYSRERLKIKMEQHNIKDIIEIPVGFGHGAAEPEFDFRLKGIKI